jgi:O-methyltransferase involved in polyketide biosynthesis
MPEDNIVDASKPSAGRIYDYILGGSHNFEVDRQAADQMLKLLPFYSKYLRLQRWPLQDIAVELTKKRGFDVIIDFASGLPTNDHIHYKVPKGTTVIYSDYDPIVVEYTREILKGTSDVYFFHADARHPEELFGRPEVQKILGGRRKVAFVLWGVSVFLADEDIIHAVKFLYDWADPGSCLVFNAQVTDLNLQDPAVIKVMKIYEQMGSPGHFRSRKQYEKLLQPWKFDEKGFISLLEWNGLDQSELGKEDVEAFGPMGGSYGAYLTK